MRQRHLDLSDGPRPLTQLACVMGGLFAAVMAWGGMAFLRSALQVRSVPERVMEGLLLLFPPDLFEAALQRFGFDAKLYALYGATAGMLLLLTALGAMALQRRWPTGMILGLGAALWLFAMAILMPLTDAGFFGLSLVDGSLATIAGHLAVALTYAVALLGVRTLLELTVARLEPRGARREPLDRDLPVLTGATSRRSAVVLLGGTFAAYAATFIADRFAPKSSLTRVVVRDAPSVQQPASGPRPAGTPGPRAQTTPAAWVAPPPRALKRDDDGAVLPSGRRPGELADLITSNDDFYIVTKNAAGDPMLHPDDWRLLIEGEVERPIQLDYASIRRLPSVEVTKTLECISNLVTKCELAPFGCDLISTAKWRGARLRDVLGLAGGLKPGVVYLQTVSADEYTTALPIEAALDPETLLVYEMNGHILPREHGYPLRVIVPGRYGMKNAKWVVSLRPMRREYVDWYGQRNWSKEGIVQTMTRIDVPARGAELPAGEHRIAGVAYAGDRGVAKVEYSPDGGQHWEEAELLEPQAGRDTWVRWQGRFSLAPGAQVTLVARATDGSGQLQAEPFSLPQPNGSAGWHTCDVRAR